MTSKKTTVRVCRKGLRRFPSLAPGASGKISAIFSSTGRRSHRLRSPAPGEYKNHRSINLDRSFPQCKSGTQFRCGDDGAPGWQRAKTVSFNWNDTTVTGREQAISDGRKHEIEDALPDTRTIFTVSHTKGAFSGLLRINYYDETYESLFNDPNLPLVTDPLVIVDAELGWDFDDTFSVAVGAKNLFDEQPDEWKIDDWNGRTPGFLGAIYPVNHIAGFNGGSYYLRLSKKF
ncbi:MULTISPECIES: TonB-dependent receptor [unclassified Microbulbifer]|uniref:TonB-dependent receptor n=1 Tax=unclassified Microbulbifer TaxID=2619833 RepID=UPI0027E5374D|nr:MULTISPECIES: TonB-dependent receptor [unclassified Microbulbifer]